MSKLVAAAFSVALLATLPTAAHAASLTLSGTPGTFSDHLLAGNFDLGTGSGQTASYIGSSSKSAGNGLYVDGPATVTYTYLGKEAGFTNRLLVGGNTIFQTGATAVGAVSATFNVLAAGLLSFMFTSQGSGQFVANDGTATAGMNIAYRLLSSTSALVFLDDFGAGPDRDFDDIGIRIDIASMMPLVATVPLPAGALLLGSGLGLLGIAGRRRKRPAAAPVEPA